MGNGIIGNGNYIYTKRDVTMKSWENTALFQDKKLQAFGISIRVSHFLNIIAIIFNIKQFCYFLVVSSRRETHTTNQTETD